MAGPITWQSIRTTAGEPADAMRPLVGAQQSFNGVFDGLQNILNQRLAVEQSNNGAVQDAYKQNYLDQLQGAKTPEELAALQPTLEQARAALSPTNRAAVRGADEARTAGLRQQVTAGQAYDAGQVAYDAIPLKDRIAALAAQGKGAEAMALAETLPDRAGRAEVISGVAKAQLTFNQTQRSEALATASNPNLIREQALKAELFPVTAANARTEATLKTGQLDVQTTDNAAQVLDRSLEGELARVAGDRQTKLSNTRAQIEEVARGFPGLPRNTDGTLAVGRLSPDDRLSLDDVLLQKGYPASSAYEPSDTTEVAAFEDTLKKRGVKPTAIANLRARTVAALTTTPVAPIGTDAARIDRSQRIQETTAKLNGLQYTAANMPGASGAALDTAYTAVNDAIPAGWENENWKKELTNFFKSDGIIAKDPKTKEILKDADGVPIRVLPGPDAIKQIIRGRRDFIGWGAADLRQELAKWKENGDNQVGAAKAVNDQMYNAIRNVDVPKTPSASK